MRRSPWRLLTLLWTWVLILVGGFGLFLLFPHLLKLFSPVSEHNPVELGDRPLEGVLERLPASKVRETTSTLVRESEALAVLNNIWTFQSTYHAVHGHYAPTFEELETVGFDRRAITEASYYAFHAYPESVTAVPKPGPGPAIKEFLLHYRRRAILPRKK